MRDQVVVGHGYHLTPLLPLAASDESFYVVTVTSQEVEVFRASRFEMSRVDYEGPRSADEQDSGSDYQNPVQASPVARPHTGSVDISHAQVYGDSPEEWRKDRLVDFARRVAVAIDADPASMVEAQLRDAARQGRIETLLISEPACTGGVLDGAQTSNPSSLDLDDLVVGTLSQSGSVRVVPSALIEEEAGAAILRF